MKKSELQQIIKEELGKVQTQVTNEAPVARPEIYPAKVQKTMYPILMKLLKDRTIIIHGLDPSEFAGAADEIATNMFKMSLQEAIWNYAGYTK